MKPITLRLGHSPDPDDAFMWYPLMPGADGQALVKTGPYRFEHVLEDIQTLNQRSQRGDLEITALSMHQYPHVAEKYALTACGSSMGDGYGPMLVARQGAPAAAGGNAEAWLRNPKTVIAVPGERTTAFLALSLWLGRGAFRYETVRFDEILPSVAAGKYPVGLIIHEGQLTYAKEGMELLQDLGTWWKKKYDLPLPLGGNAIRRDLGPHAMREICGILKRSIEFALQHREAALQHAMKYGRGMDTYLADRFVDMYVNRWTLDYGPLGQAAVQKLLDEGAKAGLCPPVGKIDFIRSM